MELYDVLVEIGNLLDHLENKKCSSIYVNARNSEKLVVSSPNNNDSRCEKKLYG